MNGTKINQRGGPKTRVRCYLAPAGHCCVTVWTRADDEIKKKKKKKTEKPDFYLKIFQFLNVGN